jgi:hypothetical protein
MRPRSASTARTERNEGGMRPVDLPAASPASMKGETPPITDNYLRNRPQVSSGFGRRNCWLTVEPIVKGRVEDERAGKGEYRSGARHLTHTLGRSRGSDGAPPAPRHGVPRGGGMS